MTFMRTFSGQTSYGNQSLPSVDFFNHRGRKLMMDDERLRAIPFFLEVDGASESSGSPDPPDVPDDFGLLELNDRNIWGLEELFPPTLTPIDSIRTAMLALNGKLLEREEGPLTVFTELIGMESKNLNQQESQLVAQV